MTSYEDIKKIAFILEDEEYRGLLQLKSGIIFCFFKSKIKTAIGVYDVAISPAYEYCINDAPEMSILEFFSFFQENFISINSPSFGLVYGKEAQNHFNQLKSFLLKEIGERNELYDHK
ncbi:hypothetical protein [Fusobacterium necrophorum]|uniref:Uncharacterized protein n=1 Tax=Fusobacterium necrophorum subsp. funduliforme TaxID=143387 RepID=A0A162J779_9FUSO|nr:hypothetical protein [Fusobacterium necrophorum]KYL05263.1 hypothetical protein A2J07_00580 [Fusobacterium necrophorum subsp. funduliforme]